MTGLRRDPRWTWPAGVLLAISLYWTFWVGMQSHPTYVTDFKIYAGLAVSALLTWVIIRCPKVKA